MPIASSHWTSHLQRSAIGIHASTVYPVCVILGIPGRLKQTVLILMSFEAYEAYNG